jgi:N-glycosylase/DNA lyase
VQKYRGLRILRQDPWECVLSYICATNTNIPQIERIIENFCRKFGERIVFDGKEFYTFPSAETLAKVSAASIRDCKAGYRSKLIKATAKAIARDSTFFDRIRSCTYEEARKELLKKFHQRKIFKGIGPKVADCILLFSLDKLEALPIDVWILKTIVNQYARLFDKEFLYRIERRGSLSFNDYTVMSKTMRGHFGKYAGYAQEYIYHYARTLL